MTTTPLQPRQSRAGAPTPYETKLAGAIEQVFGTGRHDLAGLVAGLGDLGVAPPEGGTWTEETFSAEMKRLGA